MKKFGTDWPDNLLLVEWPYPAVDYCISIVLGDLSGPLLSSLSDSILLPVNMER